MDTFAHLHDHDRPASPITKGGQTRRSRSFALNILRAHGVADVSEAIYTNALSLPCLLAYGLPKAQN